MGAPSLCRSALEAATLRGADQPQITAFIRDAVRVVHAESVHDLPPGPIIVFSAHCGLPVAGALELARSLRGRTRLSTLFAAPEDNPSTAGYPELLERSGLGINTILVSSRATVLAIRALKAGEVLTMQPDVYDNRNASAILVPFLNGLTYPMTGTAFLTLRSHATLIPAFARVLPGGRVVVTYEPPIQYEATGDDTRDLHDLTAAIHRSIEVRVCEAPDQWIYWPALQNRMAPGIILPGDRGDDDAWAQAFAATTEWAARVAPPLASTIRELPRPVRARLERIGGCMHGHRDARLAVVLAVCTLASSRIARAEMPIALRVQASIPRVASDSVEEARRQMDLGKKAFATKDFNSALQAFLRVTSLNPLDADGFLWLGNAYIQQTGLAPLYRKPKLGVKARHAWEHAAELDPKNVEAREYLAQWYESAPGLFGGSRDKAVAVVREIVAIDEYMGRMLLGGLAERKSDFAQAEIEYGGAARLSPDSGRAFEAWMAMLEAQKKYAEAFREADTRVARLPDDIYGLYHIGRVAGLSGQHSDDGIAALRRSMLFPLPKTFRYGPIGRHYWLGVLMEQKGSLDDAAAQLDSALKLSPTDQQTKDALKRVNARRKPPG